MVAMVTGWITLPLAAVLINHEAAWQGRYGLPLGVGIPILAAWTIERRPAQGRWAPTRPAFTVVAATAAVAPMPAVFKNSRLSIRNLLTTKTGYVRQLATPQKNILHRLLP